MSAREIYLRHASRHSGNVVTRLQQGQALTGRASQSLAFLPSALPSRCHLEDKGIYKLFVPILRHFRKKPVYTERKLTLVLKNLLAQLPFPTSNGLDVPAGVRPTFRALSLSRARVGVFSNGRLDEQNERQNSRNIRAVIKFLRENHSLLSELKEVLFRPTTSRKGRQARRSFVLQRTVLKVLIRLYLLQPESKQELLEGSEQKELTQFCFNSLDNDILFKEATDLLEIVLMRQEATFNLCSIPNLVEKVLERLEGERLARFCRILAVTVSDLDMYENKTSLLAQNQQKRAFNYVPVRDLNQELVLSAKGLLRRLIKLACSVDFYPRYMNSTFEIDHWMDFIENQISAELGESHTAPSPRIAEVGHFLSQREDLTNPIIDRVEALYVLSLLMVGKHRKAVQQEASTLLLIPQMNKLLDSFIWRPNPPADRGIWGLPGHNHTCECSPEVAAKIQFLRLVHSFCDHSQHRHLLLTAVEFEELQAIRRGQPVNSKDEEAGKAGKGIPVPEQGLMCHGEKGLLAKLVDILIEEKHSSTFRFWLCRSVESFLRGSGDSADQIFLMRRGLLKHITLSLLFIEPRQREVIQSSFDLLGELTKYNFDACLEMDQLLNTNIKLKKGRRAIFANLVDSNMFVRAMILAADQFLGRKVSPTNEEDEEAPLGTTDDPALTFVINSKLMELFRGFEQHVMFTVELIRIIDVDNLTQENISCLNTALVILMLNRRRHRLAKLLQAVLTFQGDSSASVRPSSSSQASSDGSAGRNLLSNLRELLVFWEDHYLHKDKDSTQLERSSQISFDYWRSTVESLVAQPSSSNDAAIANFLTESECTSTRRRLSD